MSAVSKFSPGGYRFVRGVFQYSAGVAAEPGYEIARARFAKLVPIAEGLKRIEAHLAALAVRFMRFARANFGRRGLSTKRVFLRSTRAMSSR